MQSSISKYRITKRVGGGSFGDIYLGVGANGEKVRRVGVAFLFPGAAVDRPWGAAVFRWAWNNDLSEPVSPRFSSQFHSVEKFGLPEKQQFYDFMTL